MTSATLEAPAACLPPSVAAPPAATLPVLLVSTTRPGVLVRLVLDPVRLDVYAQAIAMVEDGTVPLGRCVTTGRTVDDVLEHLDKVVRVAVAALGGYPGGFGLSADSPRERTRPCTRFLADAPCRSSPMLICVDCGDSFARFYAGPVPLRCPTCAKRHRAAQAAERRGPRPCAECGTLHSRHGSRRCSAACDARYALRRKAARAASDRARYLRGGQP